MIESMRATAAPATLPVLGARTKSVASGSSSIVMSKDSTLIISTAVSCMAASLAMRPKRIQGVTALLAVILTLSPIRASMPRTASSGSARSV